MPSIGARARTIVRSLLGVSAYEKPGGGYGPELDDDVIETVRKALGGQLQPLPTTKLRWYLADLERAQTDADAGDLLPAAQLYRAMRRDGVLAGLLGTRSQGLVRLPKRFYGDSEIGDALRAKNGSRSVFDEMFPPAELSLLDADGIVLGVGVAELVPVQGRDYPVMVRLDPENLIYRWNENRWYFRSVGGLLPITPGDGRWILHVPGARLAPWTVGLWAALGESWINKQHAKLHRSNFSAKLANPARVVTGALGASEPERLGMLARVARWGINSVFELPIGWKVDIVESNGRGWEVFQKEIDTTDLEFMVAIAGQMVTTTGGTGFANADIHRRIREDLIRADGDSLAYTLNTQGIPMYIATTYGVDAITARATMVEWDTSTPKELESEARTFQSVADAVQKLGETLQATDRRLNLDELAERFGIPLRDANAQDTLDEKAAAAVVSEAKSAPQALAKILPLFSKLPPAARRVSVEELDKILRRAA